MSENIETVMQTSEDAERHSGKYGDNLSFDGESWQNIF